MKHWHCGRFRLPLGKKTYVMGIVNATPDSFSGDGTSPERAVARALQMIEDGADILDIGGESTRPGAESVSIEEELGRVVPVIRGLVAADVHVPLSVDTTKSEVARQALHAGASIINDISGGTFDAQMLPICGQSDCGVAMMHLRGTPQTMGWSQPIESSPSDVIAEVLAFWRVLLERTRSLGIADERLCFDAGFGFGKSVEENLELIRRGREMRDFGFPTLSATSRKSTIGRILDDAPVDERLFGTAATVALAIQSGADIVRVHDVKQMGEVARVADAICRN